MKDTDFNKICEFTSAGTGLLPFNQNAIELVDAVTTGEVISLMEVTQRDVKFHRGYFALLNYIYKWLPKSFHEAISPDKFYIFVKHLRGDYDVVFEFKDGTKFIEYRSISFGRMTQKTFEAYVREQLPFIYGEVIQVLYPEKETSDRIIAAIEDEFKKFLAKL